MSTILAIKPKMVFILILSITTTKYYIHLVLSTEKSTYDSFGQNFINLNIIIIQKIIIKGSCYLKTRKRFLAFSLAFALTMTSLPVQLFAQEVTEMPLPMTAVIDTQITTPGAINIKPAKYVGDGYEVEFKVTEQKEKTFTGKFALTNTETYDIEDWTLQFDFEHELLNIQNANIIEQDGTQCILEATSNTNAISQGQTIEIIFEATYSESIQEPTIYILDEEINYQNYPEYEEEYKTWKENILKKEERKRNNNKLYEMTTFAVAEPTTGSISNEYIQFNYLNGYHGVVTTGGNPDNPNDDNKVLIFGGGSTSYTTIRIDGNNYVFTPDTVTRYDNKIIGTKRIGDVIVSQHIGIIPNQYTGRDDVVEFFYTAENTSNTPHDVGVRIMFDTMLGDNDHAPFRLPAIGDVTTETDLSGEDIPEFWQAFDKLTNPTVIAQGTLKVDKASTPDRVRFTNWGSARSNQWDYIRSTGSPNGDSAVCLYWNEQTLEKDDTLACKTFYGLSALQQDLRPPLALALTGATKLEVVKNKDGKEEYSPNPFTVTAYIENIGTGTATNTKITLNLPKGMEVINGQNTINLGNIPVGTKQYQVSWKVNVAPSAVDKVEEYNVTLVADNAGAKTLKREITIPKLQTSQLKLLLERSSIKDGNQLNVNFKIINEGEEAVDLSQLCARYYYTDESPKVSKQLHCDSEKFENPYRALKDSVTMKSFQNITPLRKDANAYIEFGFNSTTKQLLPGQEVMVSTRVNNLTWSKMIMTNDYSFIGNNPVNTSGYIVWEYMPIYNIKNMNLPIFGKEPPTDNSDLEPDLLIEFKPSAIDGKNYMNLGIRITNTSLAPIDLGDLDVKYYYTNDEGYPQSVAGHYIGGRIDNKWPNITDKTKVKVIEMDVPKQLADTYVHVTFDKDAGTLAFEDYVELNLQVYNANWISGDYILENDHSYQTSQVSTFALNPTVSGTPGMVKGSNIVVKTRSDWNWGSEPEASKGYFTSFKVGEGNSQDYRIDDIRAFQRGMIGHGFSVVPQYGSRNNIDRELIFTNDNLKAILESDIAYISGHGYHNGIVPIFKRGLSARGLGDYSQYLTADANTDIQSCGYKPNTSISSNNVFSLNMKDHQGENINSRLKWLIFGACSQLEVTGEVDGKTYYYDSYKKWIDVLKNNEGMHGVLGYFGSAPSGQDNIIMSDFMEYLSDTNGWTHMTIPDAWIKANGTRINTIGGANSVWACLYKKDCNESLDESMTCTDTHSTTQFVLERYHCQTINSNTRNISILEQDFKHAIELSEQYLATNNQEVDHSLKLDKCIEYTKEMLDSNGDVQNKDVQTYILVYTKEDISPITSFSVNGKDDIQEFMYVYIDIINEETKIILDGHLHE